MTDQQFTAAAEAYTDMVYRIALNWFRNVPDAEDVTQNTMLRLCRTDTAFADEEHLRYWLVRVAVNECKKLLRSPWRRRTDPLEAAPETAVWDSPAQSELFQQVMALPTKYRAAIYLYYYEGYAVREIAALMGANPSTVQTWLMRARGQLKKNLKEAESL